MTCRDVLELADSFLCDELLTETNHQILRHLETCPACRREVDDRRRLRNALRSAFTSAEALQPDAGFSGRLRAQLREASAQRSRTVSFPRRWLALAAGVLLTAGLGGVLFLRESTATTAALVRDAVGDHRNCALKFRLVRMPVPLEEAARRFDSAYRLLNDAPADDVAAPGGPVRVVDRHSCAYDGRRFGHVVLQYRGRLVSLLMTADEAATAAPAANAVPHQIGGPIDGLSVVSVEGSRHAIMLVGDLSAGELTELSHVVSVPLVQRLARRLLPDDLGALALLDLRRPRHWFDGTPFTIPAYAPLSYGESLP